MKNLIKILLIGVVLLLSGCMARLKIDMKVLKREYILDNPIYWRENTRPLAEQARQNMLTNQYENLGKELTTKIENALNNLKKRLEQERQAIVQDTTELDSSIKKAQATKKSLEDSLKTVQNTLNGKKISASLRKTNTAKKTDLEKKIKAKNDNINSISQQKKDKIKELDRAVLVDDFSMRKINDGFKETVSKNIDSVKKFHTEGLVKYDEALNLALKAFFINNPNACKDIYSYQDCCGLIVTNKPNFEDFVDSKQLECCFNAETLLKLQEAYALLNQGFLKLAGLNYYLNEEFKKLTEFFRDNRGQQNDITGLKDIFEGAQKSVKVLGNASSLQNLQNDPFLSLVAGARKKYWKARSNEAKAYVSVGNADIAIVTQPNGEYTIKGVRNDASQATKATFSMLNLTVEALAKVYGVGAVTSIKNDSTLDTTATPSVNSEIIKAESDYKRLKAKTQLAKSKIFAAILSQEGQIVDSTATDASRENAVKTIKAVFDGSKKAITNQ